MGERLGVSGNWVSLLESGDEEKARPSDGLILRVESLEREADLAETAGPMVREDQKPYGANPKIQMIPVLSWAHAGTADSFEEIPESWRDKVPTECRDEKAFAVRLLGDSMAPLYVEGDMLILQPSREIYSGCLAVIRLANDGILFRRVEVRGERLQLVPLNPQYRMEEFSAEEISWAYPLWGMWRQVCK